MVRINFQTSESPMPLLALPLYGVPGHARAGRVAGDEEVSNLIDYIKTLGE